MKKRFTRRLTSCIISFLCSFTRFTVMKTACSAVYGETKVPKCLLKD